MRGWLVFTDWVISQAKEWEGYSTKIFWGRGGAIPELGRRPLFGLLRLAWELSWHL